MSDRIRNLRSDSLLQTATDRHPGHRQNDGSYALQLSNGTNYIIAVDGGGLDQSNDLATNRTVAQAWEHFIITDQGNCRYTIQTTSGYYLAYKFSSVNGSQLSLTTDISDPAAARSIGYGAYLVFKPVWN